jgi:glucose/arabinose dehydrogenase
MRNSVGGGEVAHRMIIEPPARVVDPGEIALPDGYRMQAVATGLTFPTGVTFDDRGGVYVVESSYSYGEVFTTPRLLRIEPDGRATQAAGATMNGPWNGVAFHGGSFYVSEGGVLAGGRILKISPEGRIQPLVSDLPTFGDHHTNGPAVGPDGMVYFTIGTATNAAVVGPDNYQFGWLLRKPGFHDIPCQDITLTGENFSSTNVLKPDSNKPVRTGAFLPFGTPSERNQVIPGRVPCNGAVLKVPASGGKPELVAWGLRNPFGIAFTRDGLLYVTNNGYDDRGSRPVWGTADHLWLIKPGTWYGWPDYSGDRPLAGSRPPGKRELKSVLAKHPNTPPKPAASFDVHASADSFDFSRSDSFGHVGQAFVALLGDQAPAVGKVVRPVGFKVVRVNVSDGTIYEFAVNRGKTNGPASWLKTGGLERPVAARFDPSGAALYVVDFGAVFMDAGGAMPQEKTGVLWRISRAGAMRGADAR